MKDQIDYLRKWSKTRAKQAGAINTESLDKPVEDILLTKIEKEANRSFQ